MILALSSSAPMLFICMCLAGGIPLLVTGLRHTRGRALRSMKNLKVLCLARRLLSPAEASANLAALCKAGGLKDLSNLLCPKFSVFDPESRKQSMNPAHNWASQSLNLLAWVVFA